MTKVHNEIRTRRLIIEDSTGVERIIADASDESGHCTFAVLGPTGPAFTVEVDKKHRLIISGHNEAGQPMLVATFQNVDDTVLEILDKDQLPAVRIAYDEDSKGYNVTGYRKGQPIWETKAGS